MQYFQLTKKNLPILGVSTRSLKDFVTTQRDQLRQITKVPTEEFRMWEVDLMKEERKRQSEGKEAADIEFDELGGDLYDDFVIVERQKQ